MVTYSLLPVWWNKIHGVFISRLCGYAWIAL